MVVELLRICTHSHGHGFGILGMQNMVHLCSADEHEGNVPIGRVHENTLVVYHYLQRHMLPEPHCWTSAPEVECVQHVPELVDWK